MTSSPARTDGQKVIEFIEGFCRVPEGDRVGEKLKLLDFQKRFILSVYDNPHGTSRAYLSIARKNGKSALIAGIALAHIVGPKARQNSQIISGARSREQAAIIYDLAEKMVRLEPELQSIIRPVPSQKKLIGLPMNVTFRAISAEAGTAHGMSPVVAILDEVGQVRGDKDAFVEAIQTAQGAYNDPLLIAISTQAATDGDLFSQWLDRAEGKPRVVCHVHKAPEDCDLMDRDAWKAANPALGVFRSLQDVEDFAARAVEMPADENSFRWLYLNQRIDASAPYISRGVWQRCATDVREDFSGLPVFGGLDLSSVNDLTAKVYQAPVGEKWHVKPTFWLPSDGLREKARTDRVPYDRWNENGYLLTTPGKTVDYEFVAASLYTDCLRWDVRKVAFDRWNFRHLRPWLLKAGFSEDQIEGDSAIFEPFGQGYQSMSPALRDLETALLDQRIVHGGHPVLTMCAANAVVTSDPAGNRKLDKAKATGRIDGMVALAMSHAMAMTYEPVTVPPSYALEHGVMVL